MGYTAKSVEQIVNELITKGTRTDKGCLISHLKPNAKGYVSIQPGGRSGKKWRAHRLIFHVKCKPISDNMMVLHSCDVRNCIEQEHLFEGTAKDNTQDMMAKGRHKYILPNNQKVDAGLVQILSDEGMTGKNIAIKLGVSESSISNYLSKNGVYRDK